MKLDFRSCSVVQRLQRDARTRSVRRERIIMQNVFAVYTPSSRSAVDWKEEFHCFDGAIRGNSDELLFALLLLLLRSLALYLFARVLNE